MMRLRQGFTTRFVCIGCWLAAGLFPHPARADFPEYDTNPFTFAIQDTIWGWWTSFFTAELNGDTLPDFTYRSRTTLYAYDHYGDFLWSVPLAYPGPGIANHSARHGAADVDGDGAVEVVALNASNQVVVFDGSTGTQESVLDVSVQSQQIAGHVAVADLRGSGDRDIIVQTIDVTMEGAGIEYYMNRSLIAYSLDTGQELWRVNQNRDPADGLYEGYWGPAHGPFMAADVDLDGKDEVVGGNWVDHDGRVVSIGYPTAWLSYELAIKYADHLDAINVGDFRPDLPGLEWIVTQEDHSSGVSEWNAWHTAMCATDKVLWRIETSLFGDGREREPQNAAVGNYSQATAFSEVWVSSRAPTGTLDHQHPWVFDAAGIQKTDYNIATRLPAGFNAYPGTGNKEGIEPIHTIDWFGEPKDQIAAVARHVDGNFGVLDPMTGTAYWSTTGSSPSMAAAMLYVADVAGDAREEIVVYDTTDHKIKVYWNEAPNPNQPKVSKWDDPLYRRLKQNWNYYQPGSYTYGDYPLISNIQIQNITTDSTTITWDTDVPADSQVEYGETIQLGQKTALDTALGMTHSVHLGGLRPYQAYHFAVRSSNVYGKTGLSRDSVFQTLPILVSARIFLEGPYDASGDSMNTSMNKAGRIPMTSPYSVDARIVESVPSGVVDWILIQLRSHADSVAVVSRSVFLDRTGNLVRDDGTDPAIPLAAHPGYYYLVFRHRNHLSVMGMDSVMLDSDPPSVFDFTSSDTLFYGSDGSKALEPGVWGMIGGNANNANDMINIQDYAAVKSKFAQSGYLKEDVNLSGVVSVPDYARTKSNFARSSSVP